MRSALKGQGSSCAVTLVKASSQADADPDAEAEPDGRPLAEAETEAERDDELVFADAEPFSGERIIDALRMDPALVHAGVESARDHPVSLGGRLERSRYSDCLTERLRADGENTPGERACSSLEGDRERASYLLGDLLQLHR